MNKRLHKNVKNLVGQKFGKLTVIEFSHVHKTRGSAIWICSCECSVTTMVNGADLRAGKTNSCGCLTHRLSIGEDLTGRKFGRWTVIKYFGRIGKTKRHEKHSYECKCACGNTKIVDKYCLLAGHSQSCGCYNKEIVSQTGSKSPNWNPNRTQEDREITRQTPEYRQWRQSVLRKYNFTCQITGQIGGKLVAHHIFNWAQNKNLRYNLNNGIILSKKIHKLFHQEYWNRNNTLEQLQEFKKRYDNGEWRDYQI